MEEQKSNEFEDIRPYRDEEVSEVLERLFDNFIFNTLFKISLKSALPEWSREEIAKRISLFKEARSVDQFQELLLEPLRGLIEKTTRDQTYTGLENISKDKNYLFISNHRDIVMDTTLINYALKLNGYKSTAIATGINLLNISAIKDLMKLNKIVVIKRGINGSSEKIKAMNIQSRFIHDYIQNSGSVWIAQSEGRAKDGNDSTNSALIKMLSYAGKDKGKSLTETLLETNILPVSISYEYDPLDVNKTQEVFDKRTKGRHKKWFLEDFLSMRKGMFGYKGRVNVAFGKQITQIDSKIGLVADIDKQIITNYRLWDSNKLAVRMFENKGVLPQGENEEIFFDRYQKVPNHLKELFLGMYANPVINKRKYHNQKTIEV